MPQHGVRHGIRRGPVHGVSRGLASVPTDASSGKGVPLTQANWNNVFTNAGVGAKTVAHTWGFQDASGNIVATVGTDLTATGLAYNTAVSGWTRTAASFTDNTTDAATHAGGVGVNPASVSCLWLGYVDVSSDPGVVRQIIPGGGSAAASEVVFRRTAARVNAVKCMGVTTAGTSDVEDGGVRPLVLRYNRTATTVHVATNQELVAGTYNTGVTDGVKGFGAGVTVTIGMEVLLGAVFSGVNAEWTDAELRAVLTALGWTIPW